MRDVSIDQGCPGCGSTDYSTSDFEPCLKDNKYTRKLYRIKPELSAKKSQIESRLCSNCHLTYFANFCTVEDYRLLYHGISPIHKRGWGRFLNCFEAGKHYKLHVYDDLWHHLNEGTKIESYAEVMCPFNGMMPAFINELEPPDTGWDQRSEQIIDLSFSQHDGFPINIAHKYLNKTARGLYKVASLRAKFSKPQEVAKRVPPRAIPVPNELILISEVSPFFWGINCHALGSSCFHCLSHYTGAKLVGFGDYEDAGEGAIDCIGFFNTLDHIRNPLAAVLKACRIGKKVVIVNQHPVAAELQHPFVMGDEFWTGLKSKLPDRKLTDVSELVADKTRSQTAYIIE